MSILKSLTKVPPKLFRYKHPTTGYEAEYNVWAYLVADIAKHCKGNGLPPVSDEDIQQQMCERMGSAAKTYCSEPAAVDGVEVGWRDVLNGTMVLGSFILGGRETVSQEQAEARANICAPCLHNAKYAKPCGGDCVELADAVKKIVGDGATTRDSELHACAICRCSNKAQVWVPIEHLEMGVSEEMLGKFPPHCWKKNEIENLRQPINTRSKPS